MICKLIGHKFRPRYDHVFPSGLKVDAYTINNLGASVFANRTYRRDVCERCGQVIELEKNP